MPLSLPMPASVTPRLLRHAATIALALANMHTVGLHVDPETVHCSSRYAQAVASL